MRLVYLSLLYLFSISLLACTSSTEYQTYVYPLETQKINIAKVKIAPKIQDKVIVKNLKIYSKQNLTVITLILKNNNSKPLTCLKKVIVFTKDGNSLDLPNFEDTYFNLDPYDEKYIKIVIPKNLNKLSKVIIYVKSFRENN